MGGIGAHKFYAGKIGQVFLYIIFRITFIPGIIDLIEALMALGKQTDEYGKQKASRSIFGRGEREARQYKK